MGQMEEVMDRGITGMEVMDRGMGVMVEEMIVITVVMEVQLRSYVPIHHRDRRDRQILMCVHGMALRVGVNGEPLVLRVTMIPIHVNYARMSMHRGVVSGEMNVGSDTKHTDGLKMPTEYLDVAVLVHVQEVEEVMDR